MAEGELFERGREVQTDELKGHLVGALNLGIAREELIEVLMQTSQYAGIPAAVGALNAAAAVLGPRDGASKRRSDS